MSYDGSLKFDTKVDHAGFMSGIADIKSTAMAAIGVIGAAFATGAIAQGLLTLGKESIELASNLTEVQNVVDVTFGEGAAKVNSFAESAKTSFGISELAAKQYIGTMGAMLKSMQLSTDEALDMSTGITGLSGDFASFYNISTDEAFEKIRAGIAGEVEPLRQLGINMSVANLEAYALTQGIDKTFASMTQAEQTTLRYNYLLSVTADAQGDFARTSDSYANSQRLAKLATDELLAAIGSKLLPTGAKLQTMYANIAKEATEAFNTRGIKGVADVITDEFPVATAAVSGLAAAMTALLIITAVQNAVKGFTAVEKLLTVATQYATLEQWNELGALTAKQIIVAALTGKISATTAAQWLWNAAITANPVMLLVTAIGLLVGGLVLLNKSYEKLHPEIVQAKEDVEALKTEVEESSKAFHESSEEIESQRRSAESLVDALESMSNGYSGSSIEQRKMQSIVDELNGDIDGLSLTFDAQTGKLSQNADAIREVIKAQYDAAKSTANLSRYTKLLEEQSDAEYALRKAKNAVTEAENLFYSSSFNSTIGLLAAYSAAEDAEDAYAGVTAELEDCNVQLEAQGVAADTAAESTDGLTTSTDDLAKAQERVIVGGYDMTDRLDDIGLTASEAAGRLDGFTSAAQNMFEKINTKSSVTAKTAAATLDFNTDAMEQFGSDMVLLSGQLPQEMLDAFNANPVDFVGTVRNFAKASPEDLAALSESWDNAGAGGRGAWLKSLGAGTDAEESPLASIAQAVQNDTSLNDAMAQAATDGRDAMVAAAAEQDYTEVTTAIQTGMEPGIEALKTFFYDTGSALALQWIYGMLSRRTELEADAILLAGAVNDAFREALDLSVGLTGTTDDTQSGSGTYGPGSGGGSGNGTLGAIANTIPTGLASSLINTEAVKTAIATYNTTNNVAVTVQGVVESDAKLAKRVTKEFQEVTLYGNG